MIERHRSRLAWLVGLVLLVAATTACDPSVLYPTFVVDATSNESDAIPGDGVCATADAVCTIVAAVEEGNATGGAVVKLSDGQYEVHDLVIETDITLEPLGAGSIYVNANYRVRPGSTLRLSRVFNYGYDNVISVDGTLIADRISQLNEGLAVSVGSTGVAVISNSVLISIPCCQTVRGTISVDGGTAVVLQSTLIGNGVPALVTEPGSSVVLTGSVLHRIGRPGNTDPVCIGQGRTSNGRNLASGTSCGFTAPGDIQGVDPKVSIQRQNLLTYVALLDGSPAIDVGGAASSPCPNGAQTDLLGTVRPVDGNGNGTAECDIGAVERP